MSSTPCYSFRATIDIAGINPYIDVPPEVSRALGKSGPIPVKGSLNGSAIKATLVPVRQGRHRLFINTEMRAKTGVKVGDEIALELEMDSKPRVMPMPDIFKESLDRNQEAKAIYEKMPPSHRREILAYLNSLKTPEALERNIGKAIASLLKKK